MLFATYLMDVVVLLAPGAVGAALFGLIFTDARRTVGSTPDFTSLSRSSGFLFGFISVGIFTEIAGPILVLQFLSSSLARYALFIAGLVAVFALYFMSSGGYRRFATLRSAGILIPATVVLVVSYSLWWVPAFSWDGLDMWLHNPSMLLSNDQSLPIAHDLTSHHRHPLVVSWLFLYASAVLKADYIGNMAVLFWLTMWVASLIFYSSLCLYISDSKFLTMIMAYIFVTLPLMENHAVAFGYADFVLTMLALLCAGMLYISLTVKKAKFILIGLMFGVALAFLKNTGILYAVGLFGAFLSVKTCNKKIYVGIALTLLVIVFAYLYETGFDIVLFGRTVALLKEPFNEIVFGGIRMDLIFVSPTTILENLYAAFFMNVSFSIVVLTFVISFCYYLVTSFDKQRGTCGPEAFLFVSATFLAAIWALPQILEQYTAVYASPGSDVGASRFFLPVALLMTLGVSAAFSDKRRNKIVICE